MSQNLQEVFKRVQGRKKEQRELKRIYKDALSVNAEYQEVLEQLEALKIKKKKIEAAIQADFSDNQLLSDLALIELTKGESINVVDDNKIEYDPCFTVKFKKK